MQAETDTTPSLTEILYALIPALALFLESLLATPNNTPNTPPNPALDRLNRTLHQLRALTALLGKQTEPSPPAPTGPTTSRAARQASPRATPPIHNQATPPWYHPAGLGQTPEPTRTLEL